MIGWYDWAGGREAMWRFGPDDGPVVVAALPLFEEANRTRSFVARILRLLAERGIASALPDLPGQGESLVPTEAARLEDLRAAYGAAAGACERDRSRRVYAICIRSGGLLDEGAPLFGRWHLAPQSGKELIRELARVAGLSKDPDWWCLDEFTEIAGNRLSSELLSSMLGSAPVSDRLGTPQRIVRLESDPAPADAKFPGAPLWRRAEPGDDPALAALLADDIAQWVRACEAC